MKKFVVTCITFFCVATHSYAVYSPAAAYKYANQWWDTCNHTCAGAYDACSPWSCWGSYCGYTSHNGDCADFVSQCLLAGGHPVLKAGNCRGYPCGKEEIGASRLMSCLPQSFGWEDGGVAIKKAPPANIAVGDVLVYADATGWWDGTHATLVVSTNSSSGAKVGVAAHSSSVWNKPYTYLTDTSHQYYHWLHKVPDVVYQYKAVYTGKSVPSTLKSGEVATGYIEYRNDGTSTWSGSTLRLGTTQTKNRVSAFYNSADWISSSRLTGVDATTVSGSTGRFTFILRAPVVSTSTTYTEYVNLVYDATTPVWFSDNGQGGPEDNTVSFTVKVNPVIPTRLLGYVYDAATGNVSTGTKIPNVNVSIQGTGISSQTVTDNSGNFVFTSIPAGAYVLSATKSGYRYIQTIISVVQSQDTLSYIGMPPSTDTTDITPPGNPTQCRSWGGVDKSTEIPNGQWQAVTDLPYFEWSGAVDTESGINGYSVYFGTSSTADPGIIVTVSTGAYVAANTVVPDLEYYLRLRTQDIAYNWSGASTLFVFKYTSVPLPTVSIIPPGSAVETVLKDLEVGVVIKDIIDLPIKKLEYCINGDWEHYKEAELVSTEISLRYEAIIKGVDITPGTQSIDYRVRLGNTSGQQLLLSTSSIAVVSVLEKTVPVSGGIVCVSDGDDKDGNTKVIVPANVLKIPVTISVAAKNVANTRDVPKAVGFPYLSSGQISPYVAYDLGPDGQLFDSPVELTFIYHSIPSGVNEDTLRVFWYDGFEWRYIGGMVNKEDKTVSVKVNHFSLFGIFSVNDTGAVNTAETFRPKERIITPDNDGKNDRAYFSGLSQAVKSAQGAVSTDEIVVIYNIKGQKVRNMVSTEVWDGTDDEGSPVENGVYVYRYLYNEKIVTGTIVVAK
ncbi:MAG: amidase domain-containing protein [Elusimicrobiota bacterium]